MNWKIILAIITCNVVMMSSSYTMLIPFLPLYLVNELGATDANVNMWSGICFAVTFAVTAVMAPIWGKLSDTKGKKLMVIRSGALIAVSYFLAGIVTTPLQLAIVRIFQGFAAGLWPASLALMSAYAPKNRIGLCMGIMQSANISGGVIGPLLGGTLAQTLGMRPCFYIGATTLTLIVIITILFIKEPPKEAKAQIIHNDTPKTKPKSVYLSLFEKESIRVLLITACLANMVIMLVQPIMTLYVKQLIGNTNNLLFISGLIFSLVGFAGALASPVWGTQGQKRGFIITLRLALLFAGILGMLQSVPDSILYFAVFQFCIGLGFSGIFPSANAMLITQTDQSERGAAFGLLFSAQMLGGTIGPISSGVLASVIPLRYIFLLSGSILFLTSLYLFFFAPKSLIGTNADKCKPCNQNLIDKIKEDWSKEQKEQANKCN